MSPTLTCSCLMPRSLNLQEAWTYIAQPMSLACALPWVATLLPFSRPVRALARGPKCARFVTCRRVAWCPAPGCSFAARCNGDFGHEPLDIACKCGSTFCFACKEEAHRPVRHCSPRRHHCRSSVRPDCS